MNRFADFNLDEKEILVAALDFYIENLNCDDITQNLLEEINEVL